MGQATLNEMLAFAATIAVKNFNLKAQVHDSDRAQAIAYQLPVVPEWPKVLVRP